MNGDDDDDDDGDDENNRLVIDENNEDGYGLSGDYGSGFICCSFNSTDMP